MKSVNTDNHFSAASRWGLWRSYPNIAGVTVPTVPDWSASSEYGAGAINVAQSRAIRDMHAASFEYFIVDEYQDCGVQQHDLMVAIADAIPRACVLGDRLQGIFGFRDQPLVDWDTHVFGRFPIYPCSTRHGDGMAATCRLAIGCWPSGRYSCGVTQWPPLATAGALQHTPGGRTAAGWRTAPGRRRSRCGRRGTPSARSRGRRRARARSGRSAGRSTPPRCR
jgi:hypothetical protein